MGYDGTSLANNASFINAPNGIEGGIWNSNGGLTADAQGYIYSVSGNGTFDANTNGPDYGDAVMKLAPPAAAAASNLMAVNQYFTPDHQQYLNENDHREMAVVSFLCACCICPAYSASVLGKL